MKIVNRATFLELPGGTLFAKYEPSFFGELSIKEDTIGDDFLCQGIADAIKCNNSDEFGELLDQSEETGCSIEMDFDCLGRDGCFERDQLFAVYEPKDVAALIARLTR